MSSTEVKSAPYRGDTNCRLSSALRFTATSTPPPPTQRLQNPFIKEYTVNHLIIRGFGVSGHCLQCVREEQG